MLTELRKVIPSFLTRLDRPGPRRGVAANLAGTGRATAQVRSRVPLGRVKA